MPTSPDIPTSHWEERACWDSSSAQTSTGRSLHRPLPTSGADGTCRFHSGYATICTSRCPRTCVDGDNGGVFLSLALTFTGLGIWHGAGWNFAVYGLIQGVIIFYEMKTTAFHRRLKAQLGSRLYATLSVVRTYYFLPYL